MVLVSIIIPTYNRCEVLLDCIKSVLDSTYEAIELVVVDNASTDDTVETIKKMTLQDDRIKIVELKVNAMASGGRNAGIKVAKGDYLLFLDNDNKVECHMIEQLVRHMLRDKTVGLVGPVSLNVYAGNSIWTLGGEYDFWTSRPRLWGEEEELSDKYKKKIYTTCYSPNAFMVSKDVIREVGGLDRDYYAMYEEADYGYRILKAGYKGQIITNAVTYHYGYVQEGEEEKLRHLGINNPERAFHFAKNRSLFMKKYAPKYCLFSYFLFVVHVFNIYYCLIALKYGRIDIAKEFFKGTFVGIFMRTTKNIYIEP